MNTSENNLDKGPKLADMGGSAHKSTAGTDVLIPDRDKAAQHAQLAMKLDEQGNIAKAIQQYQYALAIDKRQPEIWNNLGDLWRRQGQTNKAFHHFQHALDIQPNHEHALNNLALLMDEQGQTEEAIVRLGQLVQVHPNRAAGWYNLGRLQLKEGQIQQAETSLLRALKLEPTSSLIRLALGNAYRSAGHTDKACACYQLIITDDPEYTLARTHLAGLLAQQGKIEAAIALYRQVLVLDPQDALSHFNLGTLLLSLGRYQDGWPEYQWRKKCHFAAGKYPHPLPAETWKGEDLTGKSIFVHSEQGVGDILQMLRYLKCLKDRGASVLLEVPASLIRLLKDAPVIDELLVFSPRQAPLVHCDWAVSIMDLPAIFNTAIETIPPLEPPLRIDPKWQLPWKDLIPSDGINIGIVWSGNPENVVNSTRRCPLSEFKTLASVPKVNLVSLQKGTPLEEIEGLDWDLPDLGSRFRDFADTGAVIAELDLVITVCTSVAHLAGSMGKPVWILLGHQPDWRWHRKGTHSPWYPSVRLIRRGPAEDWSEVLARVAAELKHLTDKKRQDPAARVTSSTKSKRDRLMQQAVTQHQSGQLDQAAASYGQVLALAPHDAYALHGLALVHHARGQINEANEFVQRAIRQDPQVAPFYNTLGVLLEAGGNYQAAVEAQQQALRLKPDYVEAHLNMAVSLQLQDRLSDAVAVCRQALLYASEHARAHYTLGYCLQLQGHRAEAIAALTQARRLAPENSDIAYQLGVALAQSERYEQAIPHYRAALILQKNNPDMYNSLGMAHHGLGHFEQAIELFHQALALEPNRAETYYHLAHTETDFNRFGDAITHAQQALSLDPEYAQAYNQMGIAFQAIGQPQQAAKAYEEAIRLKPDSAEFYNNLAITQKHLSQVANALDNYRQALLRESDSAVTHYNLANLLREQGDCHTALEHYDRAIALDDQYADAHWNRGLCHLLHGQFQAGWQGYRWRRRALLESSLYPHQYNKPRWDGKPFVGKRLLIHGEQGLGDTLQFVRYLPLVKQRGGAVILETWPELVDLLQTVEGIDECLPTTREKTAEDRFDLYASIMDLPGLFACEPQALPIHVPYLNVDPHRVKAWHERMAGPELRVGLAWAGRPTHGNDKNRSCHIRQFLPLLTLPGFRFYSLQKGAAASQVSTLPAPVSLDNLGEKFDDLMDTAAAITALDLVISVDTALAHLAGALGKTVWTLLPFAPDWRWMLRRTDSPWYPTMRLLRQTRPGDWEPVFKTAHRLLTRMGSLSRSEVVTK